MVTAKQPRKLQMPYQVWQKSLDEATAYFIMQTHKLPSEITVVELMEWLVTQKTQETSQKSVVICM